MDFNARAKEIVAQNIYLTMATSDSLGNPWVSPVYCAYDDNHNFYWTSKPDAQHSRNIKENGGKITFVIFDSRAREGTGEGVYFEGTAYEINDKKEIEAASQLCYSRKNKPPKSVDNFVGASPRRMYKAVPSHVWMNTYEKVDGYGVDAKIEVKLK
jgi:nitroimidazol reductase NimA-like FMN-containing flavoprotein (pyridoxamine 5'-phosphate oxidase superfamily)